MHSCEKKSQYIRKMNMLNIILTIFIIFGISLLLILFYGFSEEQWREKYYIMKEEQQPNPKILKKMNHQPVLMTNTIFVDEHEHEAVRIKYQTTKASVTNLEATMTTYQLYKSNNILWAKNLTLNQIEKVLYIAQSETMMEKDDVIREILEGKTEC